MVTSAGYLAKVSYNFHLQHLCASVGSLNVRVRTKRGSEVSGMPKTLLTVSAQTLFYGCPIGSSY